jgi:hypothetical protein
MLYFIPALPMAACFHQSITRSRHYCRHLQGGSLPLADRLQNIARRRPLSAISPKYPFYQSKAIFS